MNRSIKNFVNQASNSNADSVLTNIVTIEMRDKLLKKRNDGYGGWHILNQCSNEKLLVQLKSHIEKGDMIDVINFAAMIHVRSELYGDEA